MQFSPGDNHNMFTTDAGPGKDDGLAFFDWSSFESEAPQQLTGPSHPDVKPSASLWPPSRLSGDSSACGWDENSPTAETGAGGVGDNNNGGGSVPQSRMAAPPPQLPQQPPQQQQHQGGSLETAWAAAHAGAPHRSAWPAHQAPALARGLPHPYPTLEAASWAPPPVSHQAPHEMSWSLGRGLLHPTPQRSSVSSLPPSHPLSGQLSGTYPSVKDLASYAQELPQSQGAKGAGGNNSPFFTQPAPAPLMMSYQHMQAASHAHSAMYSPTGGHSHCAAPLSAAAALKQLTEDEVRRHVQQQVMSLIQSERDQAQLGWLHELLEMTKTSSLALLGTLRQQLDVLLQPAKAAEQQRPASRTALAPAPASSVYSDGWQAIIDQAATGVSSRHQQGGDEGGPHQYASHQPCAEPRGRSLASLPASGYQPQLGGASSHQQRGGHQHQATPSPHSQLQPRRSFASSAGGAASHSMRGGASSSGMVPTDEIGSHATLSGRKRAGPGASEGEVVEKRLKSEPSSASHGGNASGGAGMQFEPRWWRKQNNFTMTIDDIVKKMHSQGRLGNNAGQHVWQPPVTAPQPAESSEMSGGADGDGRHINADRVRQVYDKPLKEAAKLLSVSVMSLKRTCRKMGVRRWPYRKLASLSELEVTVRDDQLEQQLQPSDKEAVMQYIEAEKAAIMLEPDRDVDPLLSDLRKAKIHMKYEKWGRKSLSRGTSNAQSQAASVGALEDFGGCDGADDMM